MSTLTFKVGFIGFQNYNFHHIDNACSVRVQLDRYGSEYRVSPKKGGLAFNRL